LSHNATGYSPLVFRLDFDHRHDHDHLDLSFFLSFYLSLLYQTISANGCLLSFESFDT